MIPVTMIKSNNGAKLFLLKNLIVVRKAEDSRSKQKIILKAFAINFLVLMYYYGFATQAKQYREFAPTKILTFTSLQKT
ncbi:hypothetical protein CAEBREN_22825 [Caenorhabditis brenneri]|uniref:Uncharacterized protein n=1 Tax=Caenorhabditis brenneri TaxID=135651 RepID=G0MRR8_CAEBE|nr:hypothetical protein CAEBREN_22825 [Caenorhabditis brenneri]